jgi:hypothetical protein
VAPIESSQDSTSHLAQRRSTCRHVAPQGDRQTFGNLQYRRNRFTPTAQSMAGKMKRLCRQMESPAKNFFLTGHF